MPELLGKGADKAQFDVRVLTCQSLGQEETTQEWKGNRGEKAKACGVRGNDDCNLKDKSTEQKISPV